MSPFFGNPQFIAAVHDERVRRLRQLTRPRRASGTDVDGRRRRR